MNVGIRVSLKCQKKIMNTNNTMDEVFGYLIGKVQRAEHGTAIYQPEFAILVELLGADIRETAKLLDDTSDKWNMSTILHSLFYVTFQFDNHILRRALVSAKDRFEHSYIEEMTTDMIRKIDRLDSPW